MKTKTFEVRDAGTFIPCIGISIDSPENEAERYLMARSGYGDTRCIIFGRLDGTHFQHDPYERPLSPRTMRSAHHYVMEHWDELETGDVICVETIVGERDTPKISERYEF